MNDLTDALFRKLAEICWDGGSLDGGTLQEMLVEHGVLVETPVEKPCSKWCNCQHNDVVFPAICYRLAEPSRAEAAERVVAAVRHSLEHSRYAVNEDIVQAMREGGFWVGEQRQ